MSNNIKFAMNESVWLHARFFDNAGSVLGTCIYVPRVNMFYCLTGRGDQLCLHPIYKCQMGPKDWVPFEGDNRIHTGEQMGGFWWIIDPDDALWTDGRELNGLKIVGTLDLEGTNA